MKEIQDIDLKALIEAETGQRFNKDNKICSPFTNEKTPSFSVYFNSNKNKWQFKDFSGDKFGDAIDFIVAYRNLDFKAAREYLGMEVTRTPIEEFKSTIEDYINNQVNRGNKKGYKPLGTFVFVDKDNNPIYAKVKFIKPDGKKETPYYHIENGQVINNRGTDEVPYNYYNLLQGIADNKVIVFVEGEKDVNTINNTLSKKDYVATSIKGFKDYDKIKGEFMKIAVIGDTGSAGQKYIDNIKYNFIKVASSFKIINLPSIKAMGNNIDVTDWLEAGHTKKELLNAFNRSLDLKDKNELQQDKKGIYRTSFKENKDGEIKEKKTYITNFNLLDASIVNKIDEKTQEVKFKIRSCITEKTVEKQELSKVFDDLRSFRGCLGMEFSFKSKYVEDLIALKDWVNKYFTIDNENIHIGTKILPIENDNNFKIITSTGTLTPIGLDKGCISESNNIDILDIKPIEKTELQDLMQHLFRFIDYKQAICLIGSTLSFLEVAQNLAIDSQLHHLFLIGESQTGKTTVLEKVLMPLLNYPKCDKKTMSSTIHSIKEELAIGNYPIVYEEFKPSKMTQYKRDELSNIFRSAYDRDPISRGDKGFGIKDVKLTRPMIIAGEETIPGNEKAIITRSCIVYMGKNERTKETSDNIFWLQDNKELLNKLGKSLILEVLNLTVEEYKNLRIELRDIFDLKDRPLNTAINISCGIELLNKVLIKQGLEPIGDYYSLIEENIKEEVLQGGEDTESTIEQMIKLFNDILQDNNYVQAYKAVRTEKSKTYIRSQILVDTLFKYQRDYQSIDINIVKIKDFKKQARKSGYIIKANAKQFRDNDRNSISYGVNTWYDEYDTSKLVELNVGEIVECDLMEEAVSIAEQNIFNLAK